MYNKTFISMSIAFIKFNKNIKIKEKIKVLIKIINKNANNCEARKNLVLRDLTKQF